MRRGETLGTPRRKVFIRLLRSAFHVPYLLLVE